MRWVMALTRRTVRRQVALRLAGLVALLVALGAAAPLAVAAPGRSATSERSAHYTFAFHDADIAQVAEAILGNALGLSYTVDPGVTGKISFRIDQSLTDAELLKAFEAALLANDVVLVREHGTIALTPRAKAKGLGAVKPEGSLSSTGYQTISITLNYAAPSEVAKALKSVSANDPVVYFDDKQGVLVLGGEGPELEAAVALVHTFDHSNLADTKIRFFQLEQAPAETVADDLQRLLDASNVYGVTVVPLARMNGLFVAARSAQAIDQVAGWVGKFDVPPKETSIQLWVYHPRNASADDLATMLKSLISGSDQDQGRSQSPPQAPSGYAQPGFVQPGLAQPAGAPPQAMTGSIGAPGGFTMGSTGLGYQGAAGASPDASKTSISASGSIGGDPVRVSVDRNTNTLLVLAPPGRWVQLSKMLDDIDHAPDQILIEASILEVDITHQFNFGVDWSVVGVGGQLGASSINNATGTIAPTTPGLSVTFLEKGIQADVNALSAKTAVEVLSAPKVMALNNRQAQLQVGDQVPIITQSAVSTLATSAPVVNSVDYRNTGVILDVTPRISGENKIVMDVDQEVSAVSQTTSSGIDSPTIQERSFHTQLILNDGAVAALGGLISNERDLSDTGTPWVSDIPVLGHLFKTTTRKLTRTELIVLISAKIIRDAPAAQRLMTDVLADMREIEARGLLKSVQH
jgi:general secretion pathway protein D